MPGTYTPLNEWCDENAHRQFPLTDDATGRDLTDSFNLPQTMLCDLFFCVPPGADVEKFFLKSVLVRRESVDLEFAYTKPDTSVITIANVVRIPLDAPRNSVYYIEPAEQALTDDKIFEIMVGAVVIGTLEFAVDYPGYWEFDQAAAKIISSRINQGLAAVHSIGVGDSLFTGNVRLQEGENVTLSPSYDVGTGITTILVSANIGSLEALEIPLTSDAAIIAALVNKYGRPIETVDHVQADADGNLTLREEDCTEIRAIPAEYAVAVSNPCALPCCDKSHLDNVYSSISELNLRYARMESYYENLSKNINELQARLVGLEI